MRRTVSMAAVASLVLIGCGGGDSNDSGDAASGDDASASQNAGGSNFCGTVLEITDSLSGLDAEFEGDDFYDDVADAYHTLKDAAPGDLDDDFERVIDGFQAIGEWSEDPTGDYPFSDEEDAELELSMGRIEAVVEQDCGIDTSGGSDDQGAPDPDIELDALDEDDGVTMTFDDGDQSGEVSFGSDLPDDFPFPLPDVYEVGSSTEFQDAAGMTYSAVIHTPPDDFDAVATMYEDFLNDQGFDVTNQSMGSDTERFVLLDGQRDDATAGIWISIEEVANDADGNLVFETNVSLTWTPAG